MVHQQYAVARKRMVADLEQRGLLKTAALREAFLRVPRDQFVAPALAAQSYQDLALPILEKQTISKPSTVAQMVEALQPQQETVLEIGTGSGYATAVLCEAAAQVYTLERHQRLSIRARRILQELGYRNVRFRTGDGGAGWPEAAPFTRILVTAGAPSVPPELVAQLTPGGRMVIPLRDRMSVVVRAAEGDGFTVEDLGPAAFVPFVTTRL